MVSRVFLPMWDASFWPASSLATSMLGIYSMFLVVSGALSERLVAKTVLFEAYCLANSAPRPREAPTMRTLGILAVWPVVSEIPACQAMKSVKMQLNADDAMITESGSSPQSHLAIPVSLGAAFTIGHLLLVLRIDKSTILSIEMLPGNGK